MFACTNVWSIAHKGHCRAQSELQRSVEENDASLEVPPVLVV